MKIQTVLTFLVPAYLGCPEKETVKQVSCLSAIRTAESEEIILGKTFTTELIKRLYMINIINIKKHKNDKVKFQNFNIFITFTNISIHTKTLNIFNENYMLRFTINEHLSKQLPLAFSNCKYY